MHIIEYCQFDIISLLMNLVNFDPPSFARFDYFVTCPGGWGKSRLKTNSAQLKAKLGLSLTNIVTLASGWLAHAFFWKVY